MREAFVGWRGSVEINFIGSARRNSQNMDFPEQTELFRLMCQILIQISLTNTRFFTRVRLYPPRFLEKGPLSYKTDFSPAIAEILNEGSANTFIHEKKRR